ncbi:MAG: hypothetical protein AAGA74_18885 [Pseudomonadota bacterium]
MRKMLWHSDTFSCCPFVSKWGIANASLQQSHFSFKISDVMVVVAVSSELISASDFPVYGEFTGKICGFGLGNANSGDFCSD